MVQNFVSFYSKLTNGKSRQINIIFYLYGYVIMFLGDSVASDGGKISKPSPKHFQENYSDTSMLFVIQFYLIVKLTFQRFGSV